MNHESRVTTMPTSGRATGPSTCRALWGLCWTSCGRPSCCPTCSCAWVGRGSGRRMPCAIFWPTRGHPGRNSRASWAPGSFQAADSSAACDRGTINDSPFGLMARSGISRWRSCDPASAPATAALPSRRLGRTPRSPRSHRRDPCFDPEADWAAAERRRQRLTVKGEPRSPCRHFLLLQAVREGLVSA